MNYDELVTLAESVGLNEDRARVAAAIALARALRDEGPVSEALDEILGSK